MAIVAAEDISRLCDIIDVLRDRNKIMRKALDFYADQGNWMDIDNGDDDHTERLFVGVDKDGHDLAIRALSEAESIGQGIE